MTKYHRTLYGVFEWDEAKATSNLKKHGISFETAVDAFADVYGVLQEDTLHSEDEERFQLLAMLDDAVVIVTIFTERTHTRIISARKADKHERIDYAKHRQKR